MVLTIGFMQKNIYIFILEWNEIQNSYCWDTARGYVLWMKFPFLSKFVRCFNIHFWMCLLENILHVGQLRSTFFVQI